jgi:hypothetical protein
MSEETPLDVWVAEEKARLDQFAEWWKAEAQGKHPDRHPMTMPDGEWDENYRCWGGG